MGCLQQSFKGSIEAIAYEELGNLVVAKIEDAGASLSTEQKEEVLRAVRDGDLSSLSLDVPGDDEGEIIVSLSDEEIQELMDKLAKLEERALNDEALESLVERTAEAQKHALDGDWPSIGAARAEDASQFLDEIDSYWHRPIELLEKMRYIAIASADIGIDDVNDRIASNELQDSATLRLTVAAQARACQLLGEIIALVRNGYAEGALARWRSLHELNVTLSFIVEHGNDVAERYFAHEAVESRKAAREYTRVCGSLGYPPLEQEDLDKIEEAYQQALRRYGSGFEGPYGWAARALRNNRVRFANIEENVSLGHMRGYYRLASHGVHANPKGITFRMSQPPMQDGHIAGPSVYGLSDAITNAAITTMQLCAVAATQWGTIDSLVAVSVLRMICDEVNESVADVEKVLESCSNEEGPTHVEA